MENENRVNDGKWSYALGYCLATVFLPIIPTFLSILFRLIVGYTLTSSDLMFDSILIVAGIISSSIWGTYWGSSHISRSLRFVIMILQMGVMTIGYALYLGLFGFQLPDTSNITLSQPTGVIVLAACGALLVTNTFWDVRRETKTKQFSQNKMTASSVTGAAGYEE